MQYFTEIISPYISLILSVLTLLSLIFLIWNIILEIKFAHLKRRVMEFFAGGKANNLEELLVSQGKTISALDHDIQELFNISNRINSLALRGLFKIGVIRFNPFKDVGGDQSFAIALLNGKNNGLTLSSLYSREGARVYAKSIISGESEKYPLTEEEKQAIEIAMESKKTKIQISNDKSS